MIASTAPGASVSSKSGSMASPASNAGLPSMEWKRKVPGRSVNRTPTSAAFLRDEAARRAASLVSKNCFSLASDPAGLGGIDPAGPG